MSNALLARPKMKGRYKKYPPLTKAQQKLVEEHRWIAGRLAYGAQCHTGGATGSLTRDDLESVAMFALCVAATKYEPGMCVKYSTYAWNTARGYIQHALRDHSRMVRTPRWIGEYKKKVDALVMEGKTYEEIADELGIDTARVMMCEESSFNYHVSYDSSPEGWSTREFVSNTDEVKTTLISPALVESLKSLSDAEMKMMERYVDGAPLSEEEHEWCAERFHQLRSIAYG
jgi:DNA-directed RNA polymerase specialized sigma subunit